MGYRLTDAEVKDFQSRVKGAAYVGEGIDIHFTTTREFLAEVLPPCFEVPDEPVGVINFAKVVHGERTSSYTQEHFPPTDREGLLPYIIGRSYDLMS